MGNAPTLQALELLFDEADLNALQAQLFHYLILDIEMGSIQSVEGATNLNMLFGFLNAATEAKCKDLQAEVNAANACVDRLKTELAAANALPKSAAKGNAAYAGNVNPFQTDRSDVEPQAVA